MVRIGVLMHLWPVYAKFWLVSFSHKHYNNGVLTEGLRKLAVGKLVSGELYIFAKKVSDILNGN